ncbi:ATP/GTP-binding protein [Arthrobacter sp. 2MCAF15]|uniref:ATP/GTP-binding protein n=1 Tax=Arthrobacter sp. 2MCAF15 TaxID=3232984 RepID=UPI003F902C81
MPRSNRPRRAGSAKTGSASTGAGKGAAGKGNAGARTGPAPELDLERARSGFARRESAPDGEWMVRSMTASRAEKTYICPGCSTAVLPGIAHLVVWSEDHLFGAAAGLAERRHWHSNCWTSRSYRYR